MTSNPHLRHHPARRQPGRGRILLAGGQAQHRAAARRDRRPLHRGRLAGLERQGSRLLPRRPRRAAQPGADRRVRLDAARGRAVRGRCPDRGAARSRDAGRHHRRQELGSARASRAGDHAGREPGDDRGERPLSARAGPPRLLRRRALLRRLQGQPGIRAGDHRRGRARRAPSSSSCARPTAARCRGRSRRSSARRPST